MLTITKQNGSDSFINDLYTMTFNGIEAHIMEKALMFYAQHCYGTSGGNIHHTLTAESISDTMNEAYCSEEDIKLSAHYLPVR